MGFYAVVERFVGAGGCDDPLRDLIETTSILDPLVVGFPNVPVIILHHVVDEVRLPVGGPHEPHIGFVQR